MKKIKSEKGGITVFVIVAFLFCMAILINMYWTSTNDGVATLQAQQRIKEIYGRDIQNVDEIYKNLKTNNNTISEDIVL